MDQSPVFFGHGFSFRDGGPESGSRVYRDSGGYLMTWGLNYMKRALAVVVVASIILAGLVGAAVANSVRVGIQIPDLSSRSSNTTRLQADTPLVHSSSGAPRAQSCLEPTLVWTVELASVGCAGDILIDMPDGSADWQTVTDQPEIAAAALGSEEPEWGIRYKSADDYGGDLGIIVITVTEM